MKYSLSLLFLCLFSLNVNAWGTIQKQEVDGFSRYCHYSDGGIMTVGSADLCPIDNQSQDNFGGRPRIDKRNNNGGFSSLKSQKVNGFNRYCYYHDGSISTVGSTDLCPITSQ